MRDVELYRAILGLTAPWTVLSVDLNVQDQRVTVRVDAGPGRLACPRMEISRPDDADVCTRGVF